MGGGGLYSYIEKRCQKKRGTRQCNQEGKMGYDQYTVPDTEADEPTFAAFL